MSKTLQVTAALGLILGWLPLGVARLSVQADPADVPSLVISQIKITSSNGQFVTLYNTTNNVLDMSKYQLEYFNSYDLTKSTSSKLITLSGTVPPHGYFMVNDGALLLCYQLTVDSVSLGLSSTAGLIEILGFNQAAPGGSVVPILQDYVGWSKTTASGAQILPASASAFLARRPLTAQNNPAVAAPGAGTWLNVQPDSGNACNLVSTETINQPPATMMVGSLLPGSEPPATIISLTNPATSVTPGLPAADIGLKAPTLTELLPNPNGTGNDATDEFVELYNPNNVAFDLSGFSLQAGTAALHTFVFAPGTSLSAHTFTAYYSADTGLNLSNSGGQVKLLDPSAQLVASTGIYGTAGDGQAWALANGTWYWTTTPTPGVANSIKQAPTKPKTGGKANNSSKRNRATNPKTGSQPTASANEGSSVVTAIPVHLGVLALVAGLALLYGAYEYRTDLANHFYRLRRHLEIGRRHRP